MIEELMHAFFAEEQIKRFEFMLKHELGMSLESVKSAATIIASSFSLMTLIVLFLMNVSMIILVCAFFIVFIAAYALTFLLFGFLAERRLRAKEKSCAEALMQASLMPEGTSVEALISYLGKGSYALASEFKIAEEEITKGCETSTALSNIAERCQSRSIIRVVQLMKMAESTGNVKPEMFREAANELLEEQALLKERASLLTIQRATLLLSSMFLVPFVLGLLCGITKSFDLGYLDILEMSKANQQELVEASILASNLYVVELAAIASIFLAMQENNTKKAAIYFILIAPLAYLIFNFATGIRM
jgi:pilus assembly protein TadC